MSISNAKGSNPDIDVFAALRKINEKGEESEYSSSMGSPTPVSFGWIRATHRKLDPNPYPDIKDLPFPVLSHRKKDKLDVQQGEIYTLKFELWPTEVVVQKGEKLVLEISPKDPAGTGFFVCNNPVDRYVSSPSPSPSLETSKTLRGFFANTLFFFVAQK